MSANLYREGDNLEVLLAELDEQYPGQVRVVSMTHTRQGGMLGFFARQRVGVNYELDSNAAADVDADLAPMAAGSTTAAAQADDRDPLDALIDAAEEHEQRGARLPRTAREAPAQLAGNGTVEPANAEFAQMLMELVAQKAASRVSEQAVEPPAPAPAALTLTQLLATRTTAAPTTQPTVAPAPLAMPQPVFTSSTSPVPDVRTSLTLRRQLAELGVPIEWVSDDVIDAYRAVEQLVARVPEAPEPPVGLGEMLVIVGPAAAAIRAAEAMRTRMHLRPENVWAAGCADGAVPSDRVINDAWHAAGVAAQLRLEGQPAVIVVASGEDDDDVSCRENWAAGVVSALAPEQVWALVDATRKPSDTRAALRRIGRTDALIVSGTSRTASPASVWALDTPTAMLDGRPATRVAWAVTLLDKLADLTL